MHQKNLQEENRELRKVIVKLNRLSLKKDNRIRNLKTQIQKLKKTLRYLKDKK